MFFVRAKKTFTYQKKPWLALFSLFICPTSNCCPLRFLSFITTVQSLLNFGILYAGGKMVILVPHKMTFSLQSLDSKLPKEFFEMTSVL